MKALALTWIAAATTWGCSSTVEQTVSPSTPQDVLNVAFHCTHGEALSVRFFTKEQRAILIRNGQEVALKQQPSGSGFVYSNGPNTIRGKGQDLTVEMGRMVPLQCQAH
jgi:membrane-bound inhibitor of C-type lysozyme